MFFMNKLLPLSFVEPRPPSSSICMHCPPGHLVIWCLNDIFGHSFPQQHFCHFLHIEEWVSQIPKHGIRRNGLEQISEPRFWYIPNKVNRKEIVYTLAMPEMRYSKPRAMALGLDAYVCKSPLNGQSTVIDKVDYF